VRFLEIVVIALIGVAMLLAAVLMSPGRGDTHNNIVMMLASGGSGFCGAAIARWTGRRGRPTRKKRRAPPPYVEFETTTTTRETAAAMGTPAAPGKEPDGRR
jgi:hypothetical protein